MPWIMIVTALAFMATTLALWLQEMKKRQLHEGLLKCLDELLAVSSGVNESTLADNIDGMMTRVRYALVAYDRSNMSDILDVENVSVLIENSVDKLLGALRDRIEAGNYNLELKKKVVEFMDFLEEFGAIKNPDRASLLDDLKVDLAFDSMPLRKTYTPAFMNNGRRRKATYIG